MKERHLTPEQKKRLERRKKALLWQGEQLKRFRPFVLVRVDIVGKSW